MFIQCFGERYSLLRYLSMHKDIKIQSIKFTALRAPNFLFLAFQLRSNQLMSQKIELGKVVDEMKYFANSMLWLFCHSIR